MCFDLIHETTTKPVTRTIRPVAPEEIEPGMYLCALAAAAQAWPDIDQRAEGSTVRTVRIVYVPSNAGVPVKVRSVCLPFVLVETYDRHAAVIDVRLLRLARVRKKHAKAVFEALQRARKLDRKRGDGGVSPW